MYVNIIINSTTLSYIHTTYAQPEPKPLVVTAYNIHIRLFYGSLTQGQLSTQAPSLWFLNYFI